MFLLSLFAVNLSGIEGDYKLVEGGEHCTDITVAFSDNRIIFGSNSFLVEKGIVQEEGSICNFTFDINFIEKSKYFYLKQITTRSQCADREVNGVVVEEVTFAEDSFSYLFKINTPRHKEEWKCSYKLEK